MTILEDELKQRDSKVEQLQQEYNDVGSMTSKLSVVYTYIGPIYHVDFGIHIQCAKWRDKYWQDNKYLQSEIKRLSVMLTSIAVCRCYS